ncbi:MAG: PEP-CTERM sorting domain-containing protein [Tepidisphaeraceae bacterium]
MATVIYDDTFGHGSTLITSGSYTAPTDGATPSASSAGYVVASNSAATGAGGSTIASGNLNLITSTKTSNGISEMEAVFTETPVTLSVGGQIDLYVTFQSKAYVMLSGSSTSAATFFGIFNSQASPGYSSTLLPDTNLGSSGLSSSDTNDETGGVQNYIGYVAEIGFTGNSQGVKVDTRPEQNNSSNTNQDLVTDNAGGSSVSYQNGKAVAPKNTSDALTLTADTEYTEDLNIDLTATGTETVTTSLYTGGIADVGVPADRLDSVSGTATGTNFTTGSFDSLGFGYRNTQNDAGADMDVNEIEILSTPAVPEPASIGLFAVAGLGFISSRRRSRSSPSTDSAS